MCRFADVGPYDLREHARRATRALHHVGTTLVILCAIAALWARQAWLFAAMPAAGFFARVARFVIERNRPAPVAYPLWPQAAVCRIYGFISGGRGSKLARAGVPQS